MHVCIFYVGWRYPACWYSRHSWWASHRRLLTLLHHRFMFWRQENVSSIKAESGDQDATRARAQQEEQDRPNPGETDNLGQTEAIFEASAMVNFVILAGRYRCPCYCMSHVRHDVTCHMQSAQWISMGWWIRWIRWIRWIYGCLVQALLWSWGHQAAEATRQSVNALVELRRKVMQKVSWCEFATFARLKQMRLENQAYLQRTQANSGFKLLSTKLLRSHFHSFSIEISFPSRCIRERHFFSFSVIAFFRL